MQKELLNQLEHNHHGSGSERSSRGSNYSNYSNRSYYSDGGSYYTSGTKSENYSRVGSMKNNHSIIGQSGLLQAGGAAAGVFCVA